MNNDKLSNIDLAHRASFKESYYVMGDKIVALQELAKSIAPNAGAAELNRIISKIDALHDQLKHWGDKVLPKW